MASYDRRMIAPLMAEYFPTMAGSDKTSDDWHGFLNAVTGLDVQPDVSNAVAFDAWRKALAEQKGFGVWQYTPARLTKIASDGVKARIAAENAKANSVKIVAALNVEAPTVPAKDLLA